MGDEEHGRAHLLPDGEQQLLHREPRLGIERREGLVHQHHARPVHEDAGDADPLLHAAGQLGRIRVLEPAEAHEMQVGPRGGVALGAPDSAHLEAELDVLDHGLPGKQ